MEMAAEKLIRVAESEITFIMLKSIMSIAISLGGMRKVIVMPYHY